MLVSINVKDNTHLLQTVVRLCFISQYLRDDNAIANNLRKKKHTHQLLVVRFTPKFLVKK